MSEDKVNYRVISYQYYCADCSKIFKYILDFDDRLKDYACPICLSKLKYKGGTDVSVSSTGNCGYQSAEKVSEQNMKRIGQDAYRQMCLEDKLVQKRIEAHDKNKRPWWRENLVDPSKPLPLDKIKDVEKFIKTGDID